jgi:glycosyltransferase involved in cell wall biosynthesis
VFRTYGFGAPVNLLAMIEIVVPVYNEQAALERSIRRLHAFLAAEMPFAWRIVIADNASTDATLAIARSLARELDAVAVLRLEAKGRGRALRAAWSASDADVVAYMDVDLSTDLRALLPLVSGLVSGHSDVAIGTRLAAGARVERGLKREFLSRAYNRLLRVALRARFSDAQCGFKGLRADVARELLPLVRDDGWFFDTELLVVAQRRGLRIHEVAVDWVDDPESRVDIVRTAAGDLCGVWRMLICSRAARPSSAGTQECPDGREHGRSDLRHSDSGGAAGRRGDGPGDVREDDRGGGDRDASVLARARVRHDRRASPA